MSKPTPKPMARNSLPISNVCRIISPRSSEGGEQQESRSPGLLNTPSRPNRFPLQENSLTDPENQRLNAKAPCTTTAFPALAVCIREPSALNGTIIKSGVNHETNPTDHAAGRRPVFQRGTGPERNRNAE